MSAEGHQHQHQHHQHQHAVSLPRVGRDEVEIKTEAHPEDGQAPQDAAHEPKAEAQPLEAGTHEEARGQGEGPKGDKMEDEKASVKVEGQGGEGERDEGGRPQKSEAEQEAKGTPQLCTGSDQAKPHSDEQPQAKATDRPHQDPRSAPHRDHAQPSTQPSTQPSVQPSTQPSVQPSAQPSVQPSAQPSAQPKTVEEALVEVEKMTRKCSPHDHATLRVLDTAFQELRGLPPRTAERVLRHLLVPARRSVLTAGEVLGALRRVHGRHSVGANLGDNKALELTLRELQAQIFVEGYALGGLLQPTVVWLESLVQHGVERQALGRMGPFLAALPDVTIHQVLTEFSCIERSKINSVSGYLHGMLKKRALTLQRDNPQRMLPEGIPAWLSVRFRYVVHLKPNKLPLAAATALAQAAVTGSAREDVDRTLAMLLHADTSGVSDLPKFVACLLQACTNRRAARERRLSNK